MTLNDLNDKAVLITGGTMGIGLATGLAFGRQGARTYLTHRWGSADEDRLRRAFSEAGAPEPVIVEADVSQDADTKKLMQLIARDHDRVEVFVSNVCVVQVSGGLPTLSRRALNKSLEYSAWPLVAYLQASHRALGNYPRYVVGISSDGPDVYYRGYDYVAVSKAVMEVLGRYLTKHLMEQDVRINMVRTRNVLTESALAVHGADYPDFIRRFGGDSHVLQAEEVADVVLALCSGLLDAMAGQVINVDRGGSFCDNIMRIYHGREEYGL
jgi:NAD(P)-dependent dehydrogenase (short-subunit alcohol dehydrogenase family)